MSDLLTFALYESTRNVVASKRFTPESNNRRITYINIYENGGASYVFRLDI